MKTPRIGLRHDSPPRWNLASTVLLMLTAVAMPRSPAAETPPILSPPVLQPASVSPGEDAAICVQVQGTGPFTYKWQFKGTDLDPAINPTAAQPELKLTNITLAQEGPYRVVVSNAGGSTTSAEAVLDVDPTFTVVPTSSIGGNTALQAVWAIWADYDADGNPDLIQHQFRDYAHFPLELYRNNGAGAFSRVPADDGGVLLSLSGSGFGLCWGDYDNDRYPDTWLTWGKGYWNIQPSKLLRNDRGRFIEVPNSKTGIPADIMWTCWADCDNDGFLDVLGFGLYIEKRFFRNRGNGSFVRVPSSPFGHPYTEGFCGMISASDYDNDGDVDFFVCNTGEYLEAGSRVLNEFYRNDGGGRLTPILDDPVTATRGFWIGAVWADFNNDGFPDLFVSDRSSAAYEPGLNQLFTNNRNGTFTAVTDSVVAQDGGFSRNAAAGDYDNDGWLDLCVGGGKLEFVADKWRESSAETLLYHNNGDGTFTKVTTGSPATGQHGGAAGLVDYDGDGFLDLFLWGFEGTGQGEPWSWALYRNNGNANHWLKVRLVGKASNSFGIGAKVRVQTTLYGKPLRQLREIMATGEAAVFVPTAHFGLGDATVADTVRIEWPSGIVQELKNVAANQTLEVVEAQAAADKASHIMAFTRHSPSAGQFQVTANFPTGLLGVLEGSMDLETWTKIVVRTNLTGTVEFEDPWASTRRLCFYRVLVP